MAIHWVSIDPVKALNSNPLQAYWHPYTHVHTQMKGNYLEGHDKVAQTSTAPSSYLQSFN